MKSTRTDRAGLGLAAVALTIFAAAPAHAVVTEPNGLMGPIPVSQAEIGFAANFTPPAVVTLSALFTARSETIDWLQDAHTTPQVFSPQCAFTGELVLHGGACHIDFGWYNAVAGSTTPPPDDQIYTIIPGSMITNPWHPGVGEDGPVFTTDTIRADPNYKGGLIGFALKGDPGQDCKQTHFSEQNLNPMCSGCTTPGHWYAAVVWQSTKTPNAYYLGFEDLPMGPASTGPSDFGTIPGQTLKCDGDFNDFVYFLSGLTCDGGGSACDTGMPGVCAAGLNECVTGTTLRCKPTVTASAEVCDGLDNDCNGVVDDNAPCPVKGQVCDRGICVPKCSDTEFPCSPGDTCVGGLCVEKACENVMCNVGQTCNGGVCAGPCDGVKCPGGQVCRVGRCVDPCAGVSCDSDRVCEGGVCVPSCKCAGCASGKTCDTSGHCLDMGCVGKSCQSTEICSAGTCADRCAGATCPTGQMCTAGACVDIPKPDGGFVYVEPTTGAAGTTSSSYIGTGGSTGSTSGAAGAGAAGASATPQITPSNGCRCDAGPAAGGGWLALLGLAALLLRRARARRTEGDR